MPLHLPVTFAFRAALESREQHSQRTLRVRITDLAGASLSQIEVSFFRLDGNPPPAEEEIALTAPVPLSGLEVTSPGRYLIEATLDQQHIATFPFRVILQESPPQ
jgi:hypothetical protein